MPIKFDFLKRIYAPLKRVNVWYDRLPEPWRLIYFIATLVPFIIILPVIIGYFMGEMWQPIAQVIVFAMFMLFRMPHFFFDK